MSTAAAFPFLRESEMATRLKSFDWSNTTMGKIETWPQSLQVAVEICLNSRFPMFICWGKEFINIYNDSYVPILGNRHPQAFGRPAKETWPEIWHQIGPTLQAY